MVSGKVSKMKKLCIVSLTSSMYFDIINLDSLFEAAFGYQPDRREHRE